MKRWLLLAVFTAALPVIALACGDDTNNGPPAGTPDSGNPIPTGTGTTTSPLPDAGPDGSAKRTGCLDRPTGVQRPDKLPCELIPPGVSL